MSRFSRELRDFIQAFLAGQKISSFNDELEYKRMRTALAKAQVNKLNDPELRAAEIARAKAMSGYYGNVGSYYGAAAKAAGQPQQPSQSGPLAPGAIPPAENPAPQAVPVEPTEPAKTSALDVGDIGDSALEDMQVAGDYGDDTQYAFAGGMIGQRKRQAVSTQSFADGGRTRPPMMPPTQALQPMMQRVVDRYGPRAQEFMHGWMDRYGPAAQEAMDRFGPMMQGQMGYRPAPSTAAQAAPAFSGALPAAARAAPAFTGALPTTASPMARPALGMHAPQQHFADGGMVDDDSDEGDDEVEATAPTSDTSDADEAAHDAAVEGLRYSQDYALGPRRALPGMGRAPMANAAPTAQIEQVEKMVDPKGTMSPDMRRMAALSAVQQFYTKQAHDFLASGDAAGAARAQQAGRAAASSLMDHYKIVSNHWAAMTQEALRNGDWSGAATSAMNAYDAIPTGTKIKITADKNTGKFSYEYTDAKTGKLMRKGLLSPQELGSAAARLQNAGGYEDWLASAAGHRKAIGAPQPAAPKAAKPPKQPSLRDRSTAEDDVRSEFDRKNDKGDLVYGVTPGDVDTWTRIGAHIRLHNDVTKQEAAKITAQLAGGDTNPNYKVEPGDSGAKITLDDGREINVDRNTMMQIATLRGRNQSASRRKAMEDAGAKLEKERAVADVEEAGARMKKRERAEAIPRAQAVATAASGRRTMQMGDDSDAEYQQAIEENRRAADVVSAQRTQEDAEE